MLAIVDPCLVAPLATHGGVALKDSILALADHYALARADVISPLVGNRLYEALATAGLYPLRDAYDRVLDAEGGIDGFSGADVARMALSILERAFTADDLVVDFLVAERRDNCAEALPPPCSCHSVLEVLTSETIELAGALVAAEAAHIGGMASGRCDGRQIEIRLSYAMIVGEDDVIRENSDAELRIPICTSAASLLRSLDSARLLQSALRRGLNGDVMLAISAAAAAHAPAKRVLRWSLHPQFIADLGEPRIERSVAMIKKALRACAEVLTESNPGASHHLRESAGGSSRQLTQNGACAWRQDVDRDMHLHYWVLPDGSVQLASLRGHNYMEIPDMVLDSARFDLDRLLS